MTDNRIFRLLRRVGRSADDRWAFTNHTPLSNTRSLPRWRLPAACCKVTRIPCAGECLGTAVGIWEREHRHEPGIARLCTARQRKRTEVLAAVELFLTTGEDPLLQPPAGVGPDDRNRLRSPGLGRGPCLSCAKEASFRAQFAQCRPAIPDQMHAERAASPFRLPFGMAGLRPLTQS